LDAQVVRHYRWHPNGNVIDWEHGRGKNQRLLGRTKIIGKNFASFYTADDVAAGKPQRNLREASRRGYIRDQGLRVRKDGSTSKRRLSLLSFVTMPVKFAVSPKSPATSPTKYGAGSLKRKKIAAQKASKAKDDFLAALSHELRTPLTPALAAATYLQDQAEKFPREFAQDY